MLNIDDRLIREVAPKIKPNALAVLLAIAIHLGKGKNTAFPSHKRLMLLTGLGRDAVYKALETLKSSGLLTAFQSKSVESKQFGKRFFKVTTKFISIFVTSDEADPLTEIPDTAFPDTAFPDTANQETKQLNEGELINQLEQLNEGGSEAHTNFTELSNGFLQVEEKKQEKKGAPGAAAEKEPRDLLLDWSNEQLQTIQAWYERAYRKFSQQDLESRVDDFLAVYGTHENYGIRVQVEQDPLKFFKGRFQLFLKNQDKFERPKQGEKAKSRILDTPNRNYEREPLF